MAPGDVAEQLERILANKLFSPSPRLGAFLRYVVTKTQSGEAESIKEYAIGVEVFERGAAFDPRLDNIVRIQAARLRARLVEYYTEEGSADPVIITIPKGTYVPEWRAASEDAPTRDPPPNRTRVAVLPFVNLSSDSENEYFSDGLTDEIINRLAAVPGLQVVARTSAFSFKGRNQDVREIGRQLNVGVVLEGTVRKAGAQIRVTTQLIDVNSGFHLFSHTYRRQMRDVFDLQDELAGSVAAEISPGAQPIRAAASQTPNVEGYNAYLQGLFAMSSKFADLDICINCFRNALSFDPQYAAAWAGMSHGYFLLAWFYRAPSEIVMPLSREAAAKSVELDPDSPLGLHSLATAECVMEWQWASAESRFRRALALQPSLTIGCIEYVVFCLVPQLRFKEACALLESALTLDPFNPLLHAVAIHIYGRLGHYEQALRQYSTALRIAPEYPPIAVTAGMAHEWNGNLDLAVELYRRCCELSGDAPYPLSCLTHSLARKGEKAEARRLLKKLEAGPIVAASDLARVYCGLRDLSKTLDCLEEAARSKCMHLLRVTGDPRFHWLLPEPRFRAILHQMGLPLPA